MFQTLDGTEAELRPIDDPHLPPPIEEGQLCARLGVEQPDLITVGEAHNPTGYASRSQTAIFPSDAKIEK